MGVRSESALATLPFLSLPDPKVDGEGALDPLGLATIGDGLADWILPGFTARMVRPRFVTAIAVSAVVCEGMEDRLAADEQTPANLVFEWLVVEGFARAAERALVRGTPGIDKATRAKADGRPMCAKAYLKTPAVFGFHGVYRRVAEHLGVVDDELRLRDNGYELVRAWEREQGLQGFLDAAAGAGPGTEVRDRWRAALRDGMQSGYTARGGGWRGFAELAGHLAPTQVGKHEATVIARLIKTMDAEGATGEVYGLLGDKSLLEGDGPEHVVAEFLMRKASAAVAERLRTIDAFEQACAVLEWAFERLRFLSSARGATALPPQGFAADAAVAAVVAQVQLRFEAAEALIAQAPFKPQRLFAELASRFGGVATAEQLFETLLARHAEVQKAKPPDGKREWFERAPNGSIFIRPPYRLASGREFEHRWNRPYRLTSVRSFCRDLKGAIQ